MDVIGNNIANVNTTGFKRNRVNFQDMIYQQLGAAARPTEDVGGVNPKEVGLGMTIASIDTIHIQGALQSTGNQTDLAIRDTGFFVLREGDQDYYTRAGAFSLDENGTLVNPANGFSVQGWMSRIIDGVEILDTSRNTENLVIPVGSKDPARATTLANFACNLDNRTPLIPEGASQADIISGTWGTEINIYDAFGGEHVLRVEFSRVPGTNNSWTASVNVDPQAAAATNASVGLGEAAPAVGEGNTFTVNFSNLGNLAGVVDAAGNASPETGAVTMQVAYDVADATPGADGELVRQEFTLNLGAVGGLVNTITQYTSASTTKIFEQDGYTMGYLENFKIDQRGVITGVYSNGSRRPLGQIALATFANQGALEKAGDNNFVASNNSGIANVGTSGTAGRGAIISGTLEMSNVDLSDQFVDMIVTQRGFQANSRTIQTADQMLQEILTLKR
jgi:flagellar hook protein FlgE